MTSSSRMPSEEKTSAVCLLLKEINLKALTTKSGYLLTSRSNTWLCLKKNDPSEEAKKLELQV